MCTDSFTLLSKLWLAPRRFYKTHPCQLTSINNSYTEFQDWDSSVGIETSYRPGGPGTESRWRRNFLHSTRPALGPTREQWAQGHFRVKRPGRGVNHPPSSYADVKKNAKLYLSFHSGPSWQVIQWSLPSSYHISWEFGKRFSGWYQVGRTGRKAYNDLHIIIISIQPLGRFSRNQSPARRPVWLWHTASWASS